MANIQLPPIQPDDFVRRLLKSQQQDSTSKAESEKIEKLLDDEHELFDELTNKIEKVYKTFEVVNSSKTLNKNKIEKITSISKNDAKIKENLSDIKNNIHIHNDVISDKIQNHIISVGKSFGKLDNSKKMELLNSKLSSKILTNMKKSYTWVDDKLNSLYSFSKNLLSAGLEISSNIIHCVSTFLLGPFKLAWNIVDSILTKLNSKVWNAVKGIVSDAGRIMKWVVNVGIDAILYIWKGFSTIFKVGFTIVAKAVKYIAQGTEAFFGWWFKLLVNTIFSPGMYLINIPLFLIISFAVVSAITFLIGAGGVALVLIQGAFGAVMNVVDTVGGWIWSGISGLFGWIKDGYEKSTWLKPTVDRSYNRISDSIELWWGNSPHIRAAFQWISTSYDWIKTNFTPVIKWVQDEYDKVTSFFSSTSKKTLIEKYIDILNKVSSVPGANIVVGFAINWLKSKFSFAFSGGFNEKLRGKIQREKSLGFEETLQNALISLPKNISDVDFIKLVNKNIDNLQTGVFGGLSVDIIEGIKNKVLVSIKKGEGGYSPENILKREQYLDQLETQLKLNKSGLLDANDKKTNDFISKLLKSGISIDASHISSTTFSNTAAQFDELIENEKKIQLQDALLKTMATSVEQKLIDDMQRSQSIISTAIYYGWEDIGVLWDFYKPKAKALVNDIGTAGLYYYNNMSTVGGTLSDALTIDPDQISDVQTNSPSTGTSYTVNKQNIEPKLAKGGIVSPAAQNIIPLDSVGRDFIRSKIKDISLPTEEIKTSKNVPGNITIIEEHSNYIESYEVYTMRHLSKGLLGAN